MQLWQDGLLAMLAAIGLASIIWTVVRAVLYAGSERRQGAAALLPAAGDGEHLEEQVLALRQLRRDTGMFGRTLLVDCGLTEEGKRLAGILARENRWLSLCSREEVGRFL